MKLYDTYFKFIKPQYKIFSIPLVFFLLLGVFLMPFEAKADVFSALFGPSASATSTNGVLGNSQNMSLLQANVSSASLLEDKEKDKDKKDASLDEDSNVNILSGNALSPTAPSLSSSVGISDGDISSDQISVYVIRKGDSIAAIAKMFDVSANTILWANGMKKGDKLVEGDVLLILPVSGVKHIVSKGQTLKGIAKKYNVDVTDIAGFNGIADDADLAVGDELIIPDGSITDEGKSDKPAPKNTKKDKDYYIKHPSKDLGGYFTNPVPGYHYRSQGVHGHNGVDLAASTGTPIVAAASGTVIFAKYGWNGAYGNLTIIRHSNGTETLYAHQSSIATHVGDQVSKGEIIGYVGSTGHSTGPHLHFELHGAINFAKDL